MISEKPRSKWFNPSWLQVFNKPWFRWFKYVLAAAIVYFIFISFHIPLREVMRYFTDAGALFYTSLTIFAVFLLIQAWIYISLLNAPSLQIPMFQGLVIYINTQFARYIPGGVWNYVGRTMALGKNGVSMSTRLLSIFYENFLLVLAASFFSVILLFHMNLIGYGVVAAVIAGVLAFYLFYDPSSRFIEKIAHKYLKKFSEVKLTVNKKSFFLYWGHYIVSHLVMGLAFWMLLLSFKVTTIGILEAAGIFALAWLVGLISPLPGGLGIREGFLVYLLSMMIDVKLATQIAIVTRIWNVSAEVILFCIVNAIDYIRKKTIFAKG